MLKYYLRPFRFSVRICSVLLLHASLVSILYAGGVTVIKKGEAKARIYLQGLASVPEMNTRDVRRLKPEEREARQRATKLVEAVKELNYHFEKMSGTTLEVVENAKVGDVKAPAIVLGELATELGAKPDESGAYAKQGFHLLTVKKKLLIAGGSEAGTLNGVYTLLEKLGCDWVMPGEIGEIIPQNKTVKIPEIDEKQSPDFMQRRLWYRGYNQPRLPEEGARFRQWSQRQKGGGNDVMTGSTGGHVWNAFIRRHKAEFQADPTMYALRRTGDGTMKRMGPQLESTHPRVIELFVEDIKKAFEKNGWAKDKMVGFGIGPADGLGYSESAESKVAGAGRTDPIVGEEDRTDILVLLANSIFEKLGAEYPNVHLGCYSYSTHADYPMRYKPDSRYVQIFAPINFSRYHSLLDRESKTQAYYRGVVSQWGKLHKERGNILYYRGYSWNLAENMVPFSKIKIWGDELPFYKKMGIVGLNVEATKMWSINGPSDYVFMKLAWDTSIDWKQLLKTYCQLSFGKGGVAMERYLLALTKRQHEAGQEAGSYHAIHLIYDDEFVRSAEKEIEQALSAADSEGDKTRIQYIAAGIEALKLYLTYHKATMQHDFLKALELYDAMHAQWQKTYDSNSDLVANEAPAYLRRFLLKFVNEGVKYSTGEYSMVHRIPDELKTMFDPNIAGHRMNYQGTSINDRQFIKTRTFSTTWDAQGLTGLRTGAVWYRHHFALPAEAKNKPIGLFIGGVEDEARVWINGQLIGTSGRGFSRPSQFDLTDGIKQDGDNLLAVQVIRNSAANEIGLGGIIRPCFIFTGPRLANKAPGKVELRRVLPGGELGEIEE